MDKLLELSKDYDNSAGGRTDFWKAAKPFVGDMDRRRLKKLMGQRDKIAKRVEAAKAGLVGSLRRGYNQVVSVWLEHAASKAVREFGAGRKWYFGAHQSYLARWHELERKRGHAIDRGDLKNEWIDQLEIDMKVLTKSCEKFTEKERIYYEEMKAKHLTLTTGKEKTVLKAIDLMCAKIGARLLAPQRCSQLSQKEEKIRCELTWQQMDERVWIAGCAPQAELVNRCQILKSSLNKEKTHGWSFLIRYHCG